MDGEVKGGTRTGDEVKQETNVHFKALGKSYFTNWQNAKRGVFPLMRTVSFILCPRTFHPI